MAAPNTALAKATPAMAMSKFLTSRQAQIMECLPLTHRNPAEANRLVRILMASCIKIPKLLQSTHESMLMALVNSAELRLEPNTPQQFAVIIPYENKKKNTVEAQFQLMYKGLVEIGLRTEKVKQIYSYPVFAGDAFKVTLGSDPKIIHEPGFKDNTPARLSHVYAIAVLLDGRQQYEVMTRAEVDAIRARSRSQSDGPWVTDYIQMAKKTVVKRLMKLLPQTDATARALELDTKFELGESSPGCNIDNLDELTRRADVAAVEEPQEMKQIQGGEPSTDQPQGNQEPPPSDGDNTVATGLVRAIREKETAKKGNFRYAIELDNGVAYFTFDKEIRNVAHKASAAGTGVKIVFETGKYGNDILQIQPMK